MYRIIKRVVDITFALMLIVIMLPVIFIVSLLIKLNSKGPVIFSQERVGYQNKKFTIYKFRSMALNSQEAGVVCYDDDIRVTGVGRFLRSTSLDEIPQLINIIKGDMSFVGPRPVLEYYLDGFSNTVLSKRHSVRPGVTGLAQVNGRQSVEMSRKMEYDIYYSERINIILDVVILIKTIGVVLSCSKVSVKRNEENES